MVVFTLIVTVLIGLFFLHCYIHYFSRKGRLINLIPGRPIFPVFGNIFDYMFEPFEKWFALIKKINSENYPIFRIWLLGFPIVTIGDVDDVEVIENTNKKNVILSSTKHITKCRSYNLMTPWLGTGLLTSTGNKWHRRRKMITPTFHFNILRGFVEIFADEAQNIIKDLKLKGQETIEHVDHLAEKYTLHSICESAMGTSLRGLSGAKEYMDGVRTITEVLAYRILRPWFYNNWIFSWSFKGIEHARQLEKIHKFSGKIINERKEYYEKIASQKLIEDKCLVNSDDCVDVPKKRMAMLDLLIEAYRNGRQIDDAGIQEEVDTFIFEGYDTSGSAMCFSLLLLAEHKDIQERVRQEVDEMFMNSNGKIGIEELKNLTFLERCIKESLRLYPSVHFIGRTVEEDVQLKNFLVPAYSSVHIHIYDIHRNPKLYPDPLKFDPDRFLPERIKGRHPYSYIPFSAGPRNCIGQKFVMLELKTAIAYIIHNFYMEPIELARKVQIYPDIILKLTPPVRIKFISRKL